MGCSITQGHKQHAAAAITHRSLIALDKALELYPVDASSAQPFNQLALYGWSASSPVAHTCSARPVTNAERALHGLVSADNDDIITMKADDDGDTLTIMFEVQKKGQDKVTEFELKLLSIDSENMDIPNQDYCATAKMPTTAYAEIFKDMATIGETVQISAIKGQLKFTTYGDIGTAVVLLRCAREKVLSSHHSQSLAYPDDATATPANWSCPLTAWQHHAMKDCWPVQSAELRMLPTSACWF